MLVHYVFFIPSAREVEGSFTISLDLVTDVLLVALDKFCSYLHDANVELFALTSKDCFCFCLHLHTWFRTFSLLCCFSALLRLALCL